jgi:hypothetical protein
MIPDVLKEFYYFLSFYSARPVIASDEVPYFEMKAVGSDFTPARERKGKKEMTE